MNPFLFELRQVTKRFSVSSTHHYALHPLNLHIFDGESLAIVGESGSGKSTLAKLLIGLLAPSEGSILFRGQPVHLPRNLRFRKQVQMIFQDPIASLNPIHSVERTLLESLSMHDLHSKNPLERVGELIEQVGLRWADRKKRPHELSGGEAQRVAIARALAVEPSCLICDEPFSSLDLLTQSQIVQLLQELKSQQGLTYILISHNLSLVFQLTERVLVLEKGQCVELQETEMLFRFPSHLYTQQLLASIPPPLTI